MADASDVSNVLIGLASGLLYPNGTALPSVIAGITGIRVYVGWPIPDELDTDLANQVNQQPSPICHVSVWSLPTERNTTRYLQKSVTALINTPTLTLIGSGQTVVVGGSVPPASANNPHNAVVFVNGVPYGYAVQSTDTLGSIASSLATLIAVAVPGTTSLGAVITLPMGARLGACRVGVTGTSVKEISRQEKQWQISIWTHAPGERDDIGKVICPALQALTFINLPDYTAGRIRYFGTRYFDNAEKQGIYRRDLIFTVEYATTQVQVLPQITAIGASICPPTPPATFYE